MRRVTTLAVAVGTAALLTPVSGPAEAAVAPVSDPIVTGLAGPLSLSVNDDGRMVVAESFLGRLIRVGRDGATRRLVSRPGLEIAAVETAGPGTLFALSGRRAGHFVAALKRRTAAGDVVGIANLWRFERRLNPDQGRLYGFRDLTRRCADRVPNRIGGEPYRGIKESHPYATARLPDGDIVVADAAGNDLVRISRGRIAGVIAVLPPRPKVIRVADARALNLPRCTVGHRYFFEFVPTDVEVGPNGRLYVTSLPGGPEDASFGARGAVYRVDLASGAVERVARGFLGATNLAVSPRGRIFVTELFGDRLSTVRRGRVRVVAEVPDPSAVEWARGRLYLTTDTFADGSIVTVTP